MSSYQMIFWFFVGMVSIETFLVFIVSLVLLNNSAFVQHTLIEHVLDLWLQQICINLYVSQNNLCML